MLLWLSVIVIVANTIVHNCPLFWLNMVDTSVGNNAVSDAFFLYLGCSVLGLLYDPSAQRVTNAEPKVADPE